MKLYLRRIKIAFFTVIVLLTIACAQKNTFRGQHNSPMESYSYDSTFSHKDINNTYPWMVYLYENESSQNPYCFGEVVTNSYILTAAHCTFDEHLYIGSIDNTNHGTLKIKVASYILQGKNDLALLKLSSPYLSSTVKATDFYHGYYFDKYSQSSIRKRLVTIVRERSEEKTTKLKALNVLVKGAYFNNLTTISNGDVGTLPGDSGGPLYFNEYFNNTSYKQLIGINSQGQSTTTNFALLNIEKLQWISNETNRLIFSQPIDNQYVQVENGGINISGYGTPSSQTEVLIVNSLGDIVGKCAPSDIFFSKKLWNCKAKFYKGFYPTEYYQAIIKKSSSNQDDKVIFKISRHGVDLTITHPKPNFIFHTPVNYSYLITGHGTPGLKLKYRLFDMDTKQTETMPCINTDAEGVISNDGVWRCRIKVILTKYSDYSFEVRYTNSYINYNSTYPGTMQQSMNTIDSIHYKLKPQYITPKVSITYPINNSIITSPESIITHRSTLTKLTTSKDIVSALITNGIISNQNFQQAVAELTEFNLFMPVDNDTMIDKLKLNKLNFIEQMYIDNDEEPLTSESITYYINYPIITITSIKNNIVFIESYISLAGEVYMYNLNGEKVPLAKKQLDIILYSYYLKEYISLDCGDIHIEGLNWYCKNFIKLDHLGEQIILANLNDHQTGNLLAESSVELLVRDKVNITHPEEVHI